MPPLEGMMKALGTPSITPELKQKVTNGVMREAAGRSVDQLARYENRVLIGFLKLREEIGLNNASAEPMAAAQVTR
jgi:carnitine 3-dehydrogenase